MQGRVRSRRVLPLSLVSLLLVGPAAAGSRDAEDGTYRAFPYVIAAGDLDGDGSPDVLTDEAIPELEVEEIGATRFSYRVAGLRGDDGGLLWERPDRADVLIPARIGPGGGDGAILVDGPFTTHQGVRTCSCGETSSDRVEVRGLRFRAVAGDGSLAWEREIEQGVFGGAAFIDEEDGRRQASVVERYPSFVGVVRATPGASDDLLVSILSRREVLEDIETTIEVLILDGAAGAETSFTVETRGARSAIDAAGDLDGDGLDDVVVLRDPGEGGISARSGIDGSLLWSNPGDIVPFDAAVADLGDLTGDGIDELSVRGTGDAYDETPPRVTVLDGADGSVLVSVQGTSLVVAGEIDEDGTIGLVTQEVVHGPSRGVRYRLLSLDGAEVLDRFLAVPEEEGTSVRLSAGIGDLDGDGVEDLGHRLARSAFETGTVEEATAVSGRTLMPIFEGAAGVPLRAPLDAAGDDLVLVERTSESAFTVTAQDGRSGEPLWTATVAADEPYTMQGRISVEAADVDADGVPEVLLNVETRRVVEQGTGGTSTESVVRAWVLAGTDGSELWSI